MERQSVKIAWKCSLPILLTVLNNLLEKSTASNTSFGDINYAHQFLQRLLMLILTSAKRKTQGGGLLV